MTIRRHVDVAAINADYTLFLDACEAAPEGLFDRSKDIRDRVLGYGVDEFARVASGLGLKTCPCDGIREVEAMLFDMLRRLNPDDEIESAIGFGKALEATETADGRRDLVARLERDRDFVRSMAA